MVLFSPFPRPPSFSPPESIAPFLESDEEYFTWEGSPPRLGPGHKDWCRERGHDEGCHGLTLPESSGPSNEHKMMQTLPLGPLRARDMKGEEPYAKAERVLLDDVRVSIDELVQIIQTYRAKSRIGRVMTSSLFKKRQEEAEAVTNMAISRLQVRGNESRAVKGIGSRSAVCAASRGFGLPTVPKTTRVSRRSLLVVGKNGYRSCSSIDGTGQAHSFPPPSHTPRQPCWSIVPWYS